MALLAYQYTERGKKIKEKKINLLGKTKKEDFIRLSKSNLIKKVVLNFFG